MARSKVFPSLFFSPVKLARKQLLTHFYCGSLPSSSGHRLLIVTYLSRWISDRKCSCILSSIFVKEIFCHEESDALDICCRRVCAPKTGLVRCQFTTCFTQRFFILKDEGTLDITACLSVLATEFANTKVIQKRKNFPPKNKHLPPRAQRIRNCLVMKPSKVPCQSFANQPY